MRGKVEFSDEDLPSIFRILGIGDPRDQQDGQAPPIDSSLAGAPNSYDTGQNDQTDQRQPIPSKLGRLQQILASSRGEVPHPTLTDEHNTPGGLPPSQAASGGLPMGPDTAAVGLQPPAQPRGLMDIVSGGPQPVAQNFEGMPLPDYQPPSPIPDAGPIVSRDLSALPDMGQGRPQVTVHKTWAEEHPTLARILKGAALTAEGGAAGSGSMTFGEGFERAHEVTDPMRKKMQEAVLAKSQAESGNITAETRLHGAQADAASQQVTINTPLGPVTGSLSTLKSVYPAAFAAKSRENVAHIAANNKIALQDMKSQIEGGKIKWIKPVVDDKGRAVLGAFDQNGDLVKTLDHSIGPAWLQPTVRSSVDVKEDGNGGYIYIPKTSTTRRIFDGGAGSQSGTSPQAPQGTAPVQQPPRAGMGAPATAGGARQVPAGNVRQVVAPGGGQAGGKISKDAGYAYDPQSDQTVLTTRMESGQKGFQQFRKVAQPQIDKDRQVINRLSDVETKLNRYDDAMSSTQLSADDQDRLAYLLNSDKFKLGAFGLEVPVDEVNKFMRQHQLGSFDNPAAGYKAFSAYNNAVESMNGYQRVLSGSSVGSDKAMELNIRTLPLPTDPKESIAEAIKQFRENIPIMRRGLPVLPGVKGSGSGPQAQAGGNSGPAAPNTHVFSVSAWQRANPKGDVNAAKQAAQSQGYQVAP